MKVEIVQETFWKRALNAARKTVGKEPLDKEPSDKWKDSILYAEHSPIRLVEYRISFKGIKVWIINHFVRHWLGFIPFVHSQRDDRRKLDIPRDELPQGIENDADFIANAQALINVSRKRLCNCAHKETKDTWLSVKNEMQKVDPIMAKHMVPECIYRHMCPELKSCGYIKTLAYAKEYQKYIERVGEDWTDIEGFEGLYQVSKTGLIRRLASKDSLGRDIFPKLISLTINKSRGNYVSVSLKKDGKELREYVHRIVAKTFIPNPNNLPEVNHKDGNKQNNNVENLEWCTGIDNKKHAWETGLATADHIKKPILCVTTGIEYESITKASEECNIDRKFLQRHLNGEIDQVKGFKFEYLKK